MKKKSIALFGREFSDTVIPYVKELFEFLATNNLDVHINGNFYDFLKGKINCSHNYGLYNTKEDLPQVDFMLSLGGDGSMLGAVSLVKDSDLPIAGINFGRLGFLAGIHKSQIASALTRILSGDYRIEPRSLLEVSSPDIPLFEGYNFALNDLSITGVDSSSMISIHSYIDGELLNTYWADGIVIATPTGSTAYSLSCGGPIIMPGSGNFVITPISPHNLNVRPLVISEDAVLDLSVECRADHFVLTCDSRSEKLRRSIRLQVRKAPFSAKLIQLESKNYFQTLREKLLWGIDVRNY